MADGSGLNKNTAGALCYVLGPITGIIFLIIDKDPFVKFHAMQSIVYSIAIFVLNFVLGATIILAILVPLLGVAEFVLWLVLIFKAAQGQEWEVPIVGKLARQFAGKV